MLSSITLLHPLAHCSLSDQLIFSKCMHLHQYFTAFETFKARFRKKNNSHFLQRNISPRWGNFILSLISKGLKPRKAASPVIILPCPALPCLAFVLFCPVQHWLNLQTTSLAWPVPTLLLARISLSFETR